MIESLLAASNDNGDGDDFKHRRRDSWKDGQPMPAVPPQLDFLMVRLWNGKRQFYVVREQEIPAFCRWLEWNHSTGSRTVAVAIRGLRCIYVHRISQYFRDKLPRDRHTKAGELQYIITHLNAEFGEDATRKILRDFFGPAPERTDH
ncbi:MAG TPA: hypothetical protein VND94_18800 [Terriglobia bacterium]|nr:hypothetical protein [Terriglobia bacterium]